MIKNRKEAGILLAEKIKKIDKENTVILAIPRGGVIVGHHIAQKLGCKLDVAISKKITPPDNPEYAIGAITCDGAVFYGEGWKNYCNSENIEDEIKRKKMEVSRRLIEYRGNDRYQLDQKTVILVDDGIATGSTVMSILNWLSKQNVKEIILAIPVMPAETFEILKGNVLDILVLELPQQFGSVGQFYHQFDQVTDSEVKEILKTYGD